MKPSGIKSGITFALVISLTAGFAAAQGSLTPPGEPNPTMKTLDQVEPRIPISSVPYVITEPGSYYLTGNLDSSGSDNIVISNSNVTVDLMGFRLFGVDIIIAGETNQPMMACIKNGTLLGGGIYANYSNGSTFESLEFNISGIFLYGNEGKCNGNLIKDCTFRRFYCLLESGSGECNGNMFINCTFEHSPQHGLYMYGEAGGSCNGNRLINCEIGNAANYGVLIKAFSGGECRKNLISGCTVIDHVDGGIRLEASGGICGENTVSDCTVGASSGPGISLIGTSSGTCSGNSLDKCTVCGGTSGVGIVVNGNGGTAEGNSICSCSVNSGFFFGISVSYANANLIKENRVSNVSGSPSSGIFTTKSQGNVIIKNYCFGQDDNFNLDTHDSYGPEISSTGAITIDSPWANFSY